MARWLGMASKPVTRRMFVAQLSLLPLVGFAAATASGDEPGIVNNVVIELQVQGLSKEGCVVEIAPGHPGCKFKKVRYKVDNARVLLQPIEVTSLSADRDCSFAITIKATSAQGRWAGGFGLFPDWPVNTFVEWWTACCKLALKIMF